jgi:hypothetical protein
VQYGLAKYVEFDVDFEYVDKVEKKFHMQKSRVVDPDPEPDPDLYWIRIQSGL